MNINTFENKLLNFIWSTENSVFNSHNQKRIKLLTRLYFGFSQLSDHKFRHEFQDVLNLFLQLGNNIESTYYYYILHWPRNSNEKITLMDKMRDINEDILNEDEGLLVRGLIIGENRQYWILKFFSRIYLGKWNKVWCLMFHIITLR